MSRKYSVVGYSWAKHIEPKMVGTPSEYQLTDGETDEELDKASPLYRTPLAIFKVDKLRDAKAQKELAHKLCDFLNDRQKAMDELIEKNGTLQRLMLP